MESDLEFKARRFKEFNQRLKNVDISNVLKLSRITEKHYWIKGLELFEKVHNSLEEFNKLSLSDIQIIDCGTFFAAPVIHELKEEINEL